jgi:hypothetical protein
MKTMYIYFNNNSKLKIKLSKESIDSIRKFLTYREFCGVTQINNPEIIINWKNVNYVAFVD